MPDSLSREFACTVGFDDDIPCVTMIWEGYATSRAFRESNERVVAAIAERHAPKMMADVRDFVLIGAEDQVWLATNWIPRAMAAGMRTVAMVLPTFYFNRVAIETVAGQLDPASLSLSFFDNRTDALNWLRVQ